MTSISQPDLNHFRCHGCGAIFSVRGAQTVPYQPLQNHEQPSWSLWSDPAHGAEATLWLSATLKLDPDWVAMGFEQSNWSDAASDDARLPAVFCKGCEQIVWLDDCPTCQPPLDVGLFPASTWQEVTEPHAWLQLDALERKLQASGLSKPRPLAELSRDALEPVPPLSADARLLERRYWTAMFLLYRLNEPARGADAAFESLKGDGETNRSDDRLEFVLRALLEVDLRGLNEPKRLRCAEWLREAGEFDAALEMLSVPLRDRRAVDRANLLRLLCVCRIAQVANVSPFDFVASDYDVQKANSMAYAARVHKAESEDFRAAQEQEQRKRTPTPVVERYPKSMLEALLAVETVTPEKAAEILDEVVPHYVQPLVIKLRQQLDVTPDRLLLAMAEALIRQLGWPRTPDAKGPSGVWAFDEQGERLVRHLQQVLDRSSWGMWHLREVPLPWPAAVNSVQR